MSIQPAGDDRESGITLVELLVYSVLCIVVLTVIGSLLMTGFRVEQQSRNLSEAASLGQLVSRSVEEGVRNASHVLPEADANGELLRARVAVGTADGDIEWQCQAWYFAPATSSFYWATNDTGPIAAPADLGDLAASPWTFLGEGIHRAEGALKFFDVIPGSLDGAERVVLRFKVSSDAVDLVLIPNTVVKRLQATGGTGPTTCY